MQYMILIYGDATLEPKPGTPEFGPFMGAYSALTEGLKSTGALVSGEALQGVDTATSLRIRGGKTETMDGPFAETKETLGGFYVIDVPDLDTALGWAAKVPSATYGTVEVRPLVVWG
jgi:hypothetical protein